LSEYEARQKPQELANIETQQLTESEKYIVLDPEAFSDLEHAKEIRSVIAGKENRRSNWKKIVNEVHILAFKQGLSSEALIELSLAHIVKGEKKDSGFYYLPEMDISIQGLGGKRAWSVILHLAKNLKIPVEIYFKWPMKEGSAYPGQKGKLVWIPG
jgi:hypothetical protein